MPTPPKRLHTAEDLDLHFNDIKIPSSKTSGVWHGPGPSTFHAWQTPISTEQTDPTFSSTPPPSDNRISRITFFDKKSQPFYPPYIYTRTHHPTLHANLGRIAPLFRQMGYGKNRKYVFGKYVRIMRVDIVEGKSDELRMFLETKVQAGGLSSQRTREQWEGTFGENWYKVYLEQVDTRLGDPMGLEDVREVFEMMGEDLKSLDSSA